MSISMTPPMGATVESGEITDGTIVNADINASAAIDYSKLAALTSGNILVGSAGNVATSVNPSGDVDVSATGVFSIASDVIINADVKTDAAIVGSKLNLTSGTGAITSNGAWSTSSTDGLVLSGDGGKDTLSLSNTAANVGMTIGGDSTLFRVSAAVLATDGVFQTAPGQATLISLHSDGKIYFGNGFDTSVSRATTGTFQADQKLKVVGNVAFNNATPAAMPDYTTTNGTTDRSFDANATSIDELADVVHTIIADLIAIGLFQ